MSVALKPPGPLHSQASPAPAHSMAEPFMSIIVMLHCPNASCARVAISVHTAIAIRTRRISDLHRSRLGRAANEARRGHMGACGGHPPRFGLAPKYTRGPPWLSGSSAPRTGLGERAHAGDASCAMRPAGLRRSAQPPVHAAPDARSRNARVRDWGRDRGEEPRIFRWSGLQMSRGGHLAMAAAWAGIDCFPGTVRSVRASVRVATPVLHPHLHRPGLAAELLLLLGREHGARLHERVEVRLHALGLEPRDLVDLRVDRRRIRRL